MADPVTQTGASADGADPLTTALKEAEVAKARSEAETAGIALEKERLNTLLPDLSKVDRGSLESSKSSDPPLFGSVLAQRALGVVAKEVADLAIKAIGNGEMRVLITGDPELALSDALYRDVMTALEQLIDAADSALKSTTPTSTHARLAFDPEQSLLERDPARPLVAGLAGTAVSAVAAALPAVLSLFSAHRTISSATQSASDLAGAAAVAGALLNAKPADLTVTHDDFRLLPDGPVYKRLGELSDRRASLAARKLELEDSDPKNAKLTTAPIASMISGIDAFIASLTATPKGATRSPLATAALREQLHPQQDTPQGDPKPFTHVLLVKSEGGSAQQVIDDRPCSSRTNSPL